MKKNKMILLWIFVAAALLILAAVLLLRGCSAADTDAGIGTGTAGSEQTASTAAAAGEEEDQDTKDPIQATAATEGMLDAVVGVDVKDEEAVASSTETAGTEATTSGDEKPASTVKPTEPGSGAAGDNGTEGTQSGEPTDTDSTTATPPSDPPRELTYEEYLALCAEDQLAYMNSFHTVESYIQWFDAAKKEYDENNKGIEITGPIDLEDYLKP